MIFIISLLVFIIILMILQICILKRKTQIDMRQLKKMDSLFKLENLMLVQFIKGNSVHKKLEEMGIKTVSIYGMGEVGERIMEDILLNSSSISLIYGIDCNAELLNMAIPIHTLRNAVNQKKPDLIILSTYSDNGALRKEIEIEMNCRVVNIGELLV